MVYKNSIDKEFENFDDIEEDNDTGNDLETFSSNRKITHQPQRLPVSPTIQKPEKTDLDDELNDGIINDDEMTDMSDNFDDLGMTTSPIDKHGDLLKELTNFDPFIRNKFNNWLGLSWSEKESKWIENPELQPIMNKHCASWCLGFLIVYARKNNIITDLDKDTYQFLMIDIVDVLWTSLGSRCEDFDIKNNSDLKRICVEMEHTAQLVLVGAGGGKYNKFLSTTTSRHENFSSNGQGSQPVINNNYSQNQPKKGILGRLKTLVGG